MARHDLFITSQVQFRFETEQTACGRYSPLFFKPSWVTAAIPNPSKAIKRMPTNPPTTPPTMAAIRFGLLSERAILKVEDMYVCT